jgi:hypothetical protein
MERAAAWKSATAGDGHAGQRVHTQVGIWSKRMSVLRALRKADAD